MDLVLVGLCRPVRLNVNAQQRRHSLIVKLPLFLQFGKQSSGSRLNVGLSVGVQFLNGQREGRSIAHGVRGSRRQLVVLPGHGKRPQFHQVRRQLWFTPLTAFEHVNHVPEVGLRARARPVHGLQEVL